MTTYQFMKSNLSMIKDKIIRSIDAEKFDSHEFIRKFTKEFEIEYVEFLGEYKTEPFRNVHSQIGKFLVDNQELLNIKAEGVIHSPNIFGIESLNELWIKIA